MSPNTVARRRTFSDSERAAYRQSKHAEARDAIERAARALLTSDGWRRWAETRATFHAYSPCNCMLIAMQCPEATQVAGFKAWQQLGRQVRKGEHAIRIMAPMVLKRRDDEHGQETDETITLFRAVSVFDISQTDGDPLPQPPREPITGDSHAPYLAKLERFAQSIGYRVEYRPLEHNGGFCDSTKRLICVATGTSANRQVKTLVHEIAHAVGVPTYKEHGRADAEVIVETAAVIVCGSIGLDTSGESIPYIAGWGENNDVQAIRRYAETVDTIARTLESAVA